MFWTLIITTKSPRLQSVDLEKTQSCDIQNKEVNMKWPDWFTFRIGNSSTGSIWIPFGVRWTLRAMNTTHLTSGTLILCEIFFKVRRILGNVAAWIVISVVLTVRCNVFDCWSLCLLFVVRPRTDSLSACQFSDGHILMHMQLWHHRSQTSLFKTVLFYFLGLFNIFSTQ